MVDNEQRFDYTISEAADAIANVFKDQRWTWAGSGPPSQQEIIKQLERLKENVEQGDVWSSCGRLRVTWDEDAEQYVALIEFYLV